MTDLLIIGKNGQLGRELVAYAQNKKINFIAAGRDEIDVTDTKASESFILNIKPKIVINATAFHVVAECEIRPLTAFELNCIAVKKMAEVCRQIGAKFVTFSTDFVFDGKKGKAYGESDTPNPLQVYGLSKYCGEITAVNTYSEGTFVVRTCGIYGGKKGSRSKKGNFVLNLLKEAETKKEISVSSDQIVNPTQAKDLAIASVDLLNKKADPGIYHLVSEGYCSWADFANLIMKYSGKNTKIKPVDRSGDVSNFLRPKFSALENIKAKKHGVVLPTIEVSLRNYLEEVLAP